MNLDSLVGGMFQFRCNISNTVGEYSSIVYQMKLPMIVVYKAVMEISLSVIYGTNTCV